MLARMLEEQKMNGDIGDENTLGGRICEAREAMSLTTAQLARRLGVKTSTMSGWELDRSEPRSNKLVMLAGVLNVSPSWLLTGLGASPSNELAESEVTHLKTTLAQLKLQAESMAEQIERIVDRLDSLGHFQDN